MSGQTITQDGETTQNTIILLIMQLVSKESKFHHKRINRFLN